MVESSVFRAYMIRARLTFIVSMVVGGAVGAIVLGRVVNPLWGLVTGGFTGFLLGAAAGSVIVAWPVLRSVWHWSAELAGLLLLVSAGTVVSSLTSPPMGPVVLATAAGVAACVPPLRRRVVSWGWCAIVRHRLRLSFAAFIRSQNRIHVHGAAPLILWARPTPAGERVWVWLRAGLDPETLESNLGKLAVACWAAEVRIAAPSERFAALVRFDVTRRDALRVVVGSPLLRLVPEHKPVVFPDLDPALFGDLDVGLVDPPAPSVPRPRAASR